MVEGATYVPVLGLATFSDQSELHDLGELDDQCPGLSGEGVGKLSGSKWSLCCEGGVM